MKKELLAALLCGGGLAVMAGTSLLPSEDSGKIMAGKSGHDLSLDRKVDNQAMHSPGLPLKVGASGSTLYGFMSYQDTEDFISGWYEIEPSGKTERLWEYPYGDMGAILVDGWMRNDRLCGLCVLTLGSEDLVAAYAYQECDPVTGETFLSRPIDVSDNFLPYYISAAYIPGEDRIYGIGKGQDRQEAVFYLKSAPANRPEDTELIKKLEMPGDRCYSLCYSQADGCLYGVNTRGMLVKILTDGTMTELFSLGLDDVANLKGALTVSPNDGFLIWNPGSYSNIARLYAIYPAQKRIEELYTFTQDCQFSFFLTPDGQADSDGPAASTIESVDFKDASLSGSLKFLLPSSTVEAAPISGELDWTLYDNGKEIAKGKGNTGSEVTIEVTVEQGEHTFRLETAFNGKKGYPCAVSQYVGNDVPLAPANVVLTSENVTWDAVTGSVHNGYLNTAGITYKVSLNGELKGTVSGTSMKVEFDEETPQDVYVAEVVAVCENLESTPGVSGKCVIGKPWDLPVTVVPTVHDWDMCTTINADGSPEYGEWRYSEAWEVPCFASGWSFEDPNDWLILPAAAFPDNKVVYQVSLDAARGGYSAMEYFEVWAGEAPTIEAMTIPVIPKTRAQKFNEWIEYSGKFAVPHDGTYYVAIRACSASNQKDLIVKNIRITATDETAAVPATVSDLTLESSSNPDLTATVSFNLPEDYITGEKIAADKELTVRVKATETKEVTGLPGAHLTVTVGTSQGDNYITVTPIADGVEGTPAEVSVFTGMDYLSFCENFEGVVSPDNMSVKLTWEPPVEGLEGGYVASTGIEYMIGQINSSGEFLEDPFCAGVDITEYTMVLPEGTKQDYMRIGIAAQNAAGISPARSFVGRVVGTPYKMPVEEHFENMEITYTPLQANMPSQKYQNGSWTWCQPELVDPSFASSNVEFAVIGYTEEPEAWVRMGLPKISSTGLDNAHAVFRIWNGKGSATNKSIYATLYGMASPEKIADIELGTGWQDVVVEIPSKYLGQLWFGLYIDGCLPTETNYLILGGYSLLPTSGVASEVADAASIVRNGDKLTVSNPASEMVTVVSASGVTLYSGTAAEAIVSLPSAGTYIVTVGPRSYKIAY